MRSKTRRRTAVRYGVASFFAVTIISNWSSHALLNARAQPPGVGPSYALVCRAGEQLELFLELNHRHLPGQTDPSHELHPDGHMWFQPNDREAGLRGEHLAPGTCAWPDRPLQTSEAGHVTWIDAQYSVMIPLRPSGIPRTQAPIYSIRTLRYAGEGLSLITVRQSDQFPAWSGGPVQPLNGTLSVLDFWPRNAPLSPPGNEPSTSGSARPSQTAGSSVGAGATSATQFRRGPGDAFQIRTGNGEWIDAGGILTSDPASAPLPSGTTFVAGRGRDSAIWVTTCAQGKCSGWTSIGGIVTSGPKVVAGPNGNLRVTATGQDGRPWTNVFDAAQEKWSGWAQGADEK